MPATAHKLAKKPPLRTFRATMLVTRAEEWWVEAETAEQAQALLAAGSGHHTGHGERVYVEVDEMLEEG
jgi:uncharacterized protein YbaP (TraB family)